MSKTDHSRKLLVRTALVTSTTMATLIGAQNFAMLDARDFQIDLTPSSESNEVVVVAPSVTRTPVQIERAAPNITILRAAPSITILRHSGEVTISQSSAVDVRSIQPPAPSQITPPDPLVIQQPVPQSSRSTR